MRLKTLGIWDEPLINYIRKWFRVGTREVYLALIEEKSGWKIILAIDRHVMMRLDSAVEATHGMMAWHFLRK